MTPSCIWKSFQLILGLGLPMEVDVSMIIGYVMKFNYVLPYNASYLTDSYVRYDRSISPGVEVDGNDAPTSDHQGTRTSHLSASMRFRHFFIGQAAASFIV